MNNELRNVRHGGLFSILLVACCMAISTTLRAEEVPGFDGHAIADSADLDALRGMNGDTRITVQTEQNLNAAVTGSSFSAGTINGGSVTIAEHALDNFSGIGLFNIVTGNNNAVDSAVGVTFNLQ